MKKIVKKMFEGFFLNTKPGEFYLTGINKPLNKWQEQVQNNGRYTIDWK